MSEKLSSSIARAGKNWTAIGPWNVPAVCARFASTARDLESELALLRKAVRQLGIFHRLLTGLMSESRAVAGFHLNGDEADWSEFDFGSVDDDVLELIKELGSK